MTVGELTDQLDDKDNESLKDIQDGSPIRVTMPDGQQLDVVGVSAQDVAGPDKGEKYLLLHLDQPMGV